MNDQELIDQLTLAFKLISTLANAMGLLSNRVIEAEARIATLEAQSIIHKARA